MPLIEAFCSKSPTRQIRYGDGALQAMRSQAGSIHPIQVLKFLKIFKQLSPVHETFPVGGDLQG
jgi:hypothetical protein